MAVFPCPTLDKAPETASIITAWLFRNELRSQRRGRIAGQHQGIRGSYPFMANDPQFICGFVRAAVPAMLLPSQGSPNSSRARAVPGPTTRIKELLIGALLRRIQDIIRHFRLCGLSRFALGRGHELYASRRLARMGRRASLTGSIGGLKS